MAVTIKGATTIRGNTTVGFSPASLFAAGEQGVWYDPSDFSTMFQDTAGTTPVTATGQSVARINDKSGRGNHATQSNSSFQPTLQIDGNGKYYLLFDGSNDYLSTSSINLTGTNKAGIFAGITKNSDSTSSGIVTEFTTNVNTNSGSFNLRAPANAGTGKTVATFSCGTTLQGAESSDIYASPIQLVCTSSFDISAPSITLRVNGSQVAQNTSSQGTGNYSNSALYVGARGGSSVFFNGRIYGLIIRGAASTASQIAMTETYMNSKTAAY